MKLYLTKLVDIIFAAIGVLAAVALINETELYSQCSDAELIMMTFAMATAVVWLKTLATVVAKKVLVKSISDQLKKEAE